MSAKKSLPKPEADFFFPKSNVLKTEYLPEKVIWQVDANSKSSESNKKNHMNKNVISTQGDTRN